jgi:xanthine dehydrogenase accessory factor
VDEPEPKGGSLYDALVAALRAHRPVALATVVDGPGTGRKLLVRPGTRTLGTLGDPDLDRKVARDARGALQAGRTGVRHYQACPADTAGAADGRAADASEAGVPTVDDVPMAVFVECFVPPPRMLVFGAVDFSAALVRVAKVLGYRVTVCDARAVFATRPRFPDADEVVVDWPQRLLARVGPSLTPRDAVCVLTHDARFDVPALKAALGTRVGYVGAMGSRRTHADRLRRLEEAGVDGEALARIHSPIGLDLGAATPEETAVSICAEIIAHRSGRTDPRPLALTDGPIHGPRPGDHGGHGAQGDPAETGAAPADQGGGTGRAGHRHRVGGLANRLPI